MGKGIHKKTSWSDDDLPVIEAPEPSKTTHLAWSDDDLPTLSQKKSPDVSVAGSEDNSQTGQGISLQTNDWSPSPAIDITNLQGVAVGMDGKPYVGIHPKSIPVTKTADDIKANTVNASNYLAQDITDNLQNLPLAYQQNLKNTSFTSPGNIIHDITDPHGDPAMTAGYMNTRLTQLNRDHLAQQQAFQAKLANDPSVDLSQGSKIESDYFNKNHALKENASHLIDLQLANKAQQDKTFDPILLGIEKQKLLGNKKAEQDAIDYQNKRTLIPQAKFAYQAIGLSLLQNAKENTAANGQDAIAEQFGEHSDDPQKRLEKDNPEVFKNERVQQIANQIYKTENPVYGTIFSRESVSQKEMEDAAMQIGLTKKQIENIKPEDIPRRAGLINQAVQGFANTIGAPLYEGAMRGLAARGLVNQEAVNARFTPGWEEESGFGHLFTGNTPQAQHELSVDNVRGVIGTMAKGIGDLGGFLVAGEAGANLLKGTELIPDVIKANKVSNFATAALPSYNAAYEKSMQVIGDDPNKEAERQLYSISNGIIGGALMMIDPKADIGRDIIGDTKGGADFIKTLKKGGLADLTKEDLTAKYAQIIQETGKHLGLQVAIPVAQTAAENLSDMVFDPKGNHELTDNTKQAAISGAIGMLIPSVAAGMHTPHNQTAMNKSMMWEVGSNSRPYREEVVNAYKFGELSKDDALTAINSINKYASIIKNDVPVESLLSGKKLSPEQQQNYAWNLLRSNDLNDKLDRLNAGSNPDKSQVKIVSDELTKLTGERTDILNKAGEIVPKERPLPAIYTEPTGEPVNNSKKTTDESKEDLSLNPDLNSTSDGQKSINDQDNGQSRTKDGSTQEIGTNSEIRQAASLETGEGQDSRQVEAPGGTNNKEGGAEMQPPISVSGKERRKRKPLVVDEEPIPVVEEPKLQTQNLGEVKGQPEAKTADQVKEATIAHPDKPADVLVADHPQGESFNEAKDRFKSALDEIAKDAPDNSVVVTHSWGLKLIDAAEKTGWDHPELAAGHQKGTTEPGDLIPYKMEDGRTIWFARHGETEDNTNDLQRTDNTPLTEKGTEQAKEIADKLKEKGITPSQIITSDLPRAKETSDIISKEFKSAQKESLGGDLKNAVPKEKMKDVSLISVSELDKIRTQRKELVPSENVEPVSTMKDEGIKEPLSVKRTQNDDGTYNYTLQNGHHRLDEAIKLGAEKLPVIIKERNEIVKANNLKSETDASTHSKERSESGQEEEIKTPEGFTASKSNDSRKDGKHIFKKQDGDISHEIVVKQDGSAYVTTTDKKSLWGVDEHSQTMESDIKEFSNLDEAVKYVNEQKPEIKFKTSKGSEYILHADGTTTRNKAPREDVGHEGEQGTQPRSERTYFITKEDLGKLDKVQTSGWPEGETPTIADIGNGKIAVGITGGERHGKYLPETKVEYSTEPQPGLYPLEVLKGGTIHHFGNEITSVENIGKPEETPQSNGAIAIATTKEQPAQPPKEKTSQERLSEIEEDLKKQRASQKLEGEKRAAAEKNKDIPAANKANDNWHKKKEKIDKLEEEKESIQKKMEREEREESIKKTYNDFADKLEKKYEDNKEKHKGVALSGIIGLSTKIGDHVADFVVARAIEGIRELSNIHIAIDRAIRLAKEKFGAEADDLSKKDINTIRTHLIDQLGQKEPKIDKEPVLPIDQEEYAKDIVADIKNGHITAEEGFQEVIDEQILNRQGQPVSDHVSENNKAKIQNYIKWHVDQDVTSIRNETTRLRREQFGLNEEIPAAKKEFGKTWDEAKQKIEDNPQKIPELIHELSQKARPLTDVENAILLHHQNTKEIELLGHNDKINKAAEEGDQPAIEEYKAAKARVLDELQQIYDINKAVGTENARGLASRRMMVDRKYSLVNMLSEKRATANEGKPLSEQQQQEVEALHQKIKETQDAFDDYIKKSESQIIDLQRKALNGKLKDKKTASTKLRQWAERIRNASKNQAYSSPIPITPHMVADAIDLIAYGVEKGEQLIDLVKKAVAATSKGNPGIDEEQLEREINKSLIDSGILEVSPERRAATDMSGLFANGKLDREAIRLKTDADRAKAQYEINLKKDKEAERSNLAKAQNLFVKWERAFKLSNPLTMGKLMMAGFTRLVTTPLEDIVGGAYSVLLPQLAKGSIGEGGGLNINETARTYKNGLMLGIKDAKEIMSKKSQGKSQLDVLFGKAGELPPEAIDFFGQLHSATKAPVKRVMFERSLERRLRRNLANGVDITDPMVQTSIMVGAYKDANRAIFMQDNKVAEGWQKLIKHFEQIDPKTNEPRMQGVATAMQVLVPFVKVPSNIVAETGKHIYGVPVGAYKLLHASFTKGIENLSEDQKDIILRNLKKGSLGVAAMALGYFNAQNFGGYYQPGQKRDEKDAEALGFQFFGQKVPAWVGEAPIFQAMQFGATVKRVSNHYISGEKEGLPEGVITGLLDVVQANPLANQPLRIGALFKSSKERQYYLGELAKSTVDPAIITYLAKVTDPADKGNPIRKALAPENKRKTPKTVIEHIKSGLPFLREQLPTKEEDWSQ